MIVAGWLLLDPLNVPGDGLQPGALEVRDGCIANIWLGDIPVDDHHDDANVLGGRDCLISPGFIDAHVHIPQWDAIGHAGLPLLEWLRDVIYPAEEQWHSAAFAQQQSLRALRDMLGAGTLGCAAWLTSHADAQQAFAMAHARLPVRTLAGRVLMDRNGPASLTTQQVDAPPEPACGDARLSRSINPRFALSCTSAMLARAGNDAAQSGAFVHTHLAETQEECAAARAAFPDALHYADVYDMHGLLGQRTLLAHCLHLSPPEWQLIAERGSAVVHCPTANTFLGAGIFDMRSAMEHGIRVGLGSDVAAGPDISMPRVARAMLDVARLRRALIDADAIAPTAAQAWHMMTQGNADILGWHDTGRIAVGASADILVLRPPFAIDPGDSRWISRLLYQWDDCWIAQRILAGRAMHHVE